ncbi:MAG: UDP-N-acetylmuramoyl-tripeptide--D-alanyl-D-alanine ligase [Acidimicrobiia bacterium]|nr:MAG: UDP-N-acetylmuramoyl-tripeptide--D-alanyl-D-alanine ligase [Acidimicrobiia bacterium]
MIEPELDLHWTLGDIARSLGGVLVGDPSVSITAVTTDSRSVPTDALFIAISGERFNGHDFAASAIAEGAAAVVVESGQCRDLTPRIEVEGTIEALRALAVERRTELTMPVVGITGSTGKTTTKDLVAAGITGAWASPRSYNNEIGVPLTVLSTPADAAALIVEVGSRGAGDIRWLASAIRPDVAVITNLGVVHLETFGSESGLADAKFELIEALSLSGTAVIPSDEPRLHRSIEQRTITFGTSPADVVVSRSGVNRDGAAIYELLVAADTYSGTLAMAGSRQAFNVAAAVGVAMALGSSIESFLAGIQTVSGSPWRMDVHPGLYTVVNDAYNANPQSVAAALHTVAAMPGRSIAALGPMAELGGVCESQHRAMGALAASLGFAKVVVVGPDHGYALGAPRLVTHATDIHAARDTLTDILEPGDVVLVKASRSAGLERLALAIIKEATP